MPAAPIVRCIGSCRASESSSSARDGQFRGQVRQRYLRAGRAGWSPPSWATILRAASASMGPASAVT